MDVVKVGQTVAIIEINEVVFEEGHDSDG